MTQWSDKPEKQKAEKYKQWQPCSVTIVTVCPRGKAQWWRKWWQWQCNDKYAKKGNMFPNCLSQENLLFSQEEAVEKASKLRMTMWENEAAWREDNGEKTPEEKASVNLSSLQSNPSIPPPKQKTDFPCWGWWACVQAGGTGGSGARYFDSVRLTWPKLLSSPCPIPILSVEDCECEWWQLSMRLLGDSDNKFLEGWQKHCILLEAEIMGGLSWAVSISVSGCWERLSSPIWPQRGCRGLPLSPRRAWPSPQPRWEERQRKPILWLPWPQSPTHSREGEGPLPREAWASLQKLAGWQTWWYYNYLTVEIQLEGRVCYYAMPVFIQWPSPPKTSGWRRRKENNPNLHCGEKWGSEWRGTEADIVSSDWLAENYRRKKPNSAPIRSHHSIMWRKKYWKYGEGKACPNEEEIMTYEWLKHYY